MGKRSNATLIELDDAAGFEERVRSAKHRQLEAPARVVSSAIALLAIRDSDEFVVPEAVDSMLQHQRKHHHAAADGEFFSVTDDENDDGRHSPFPQEVKSSSCRQPPPPPSALRQPVLPSGGPMTHTSKTATTKLPLLGKPLPPPPSLAPHMASKVKPINLVILSSVRPIHKSG
jgi:hypothetical protein